MRISVIHEFNDCHDSSTAISNDLSIKLQHGHIHGFNLPHQWWIDDYATPGDGALHPTQRSIQLATIHL